MNLENRLHKLLAQTYAHSKSLRPADGFSSPRDIKLLAQQNKQMAVFGKLQEAIRILNPHYEYDPSYN